MEQFAGIIPEWPVFTVSDRGGEMSPGGTRHSDSAGEGDAAGVSDWQDRGVARQDVEGFHPQEFRLFPVRG